MRTEKQRPQSLISSRGVRKEGSQRASTDYNMHGGVPGLNISVLDSLACFDARNLTLVNYGRFIFLSYFSAVAVTYHDKIELGKEWFILIDSSGYSTLCWGNQGSRSLKEFLASTCKI